MASMLLVTALTFTVLSAVVIANPVQDSMPKIPVTLYYESYCPDSLKFLTKQLYPVYTTPLVSFFNLTLVPYGKSTYTRNESGGYTFSCHHGAKECVGNKVHACAIHLLPTLDEAFKFINCASNKIVEDPKTENFPGQQCADFKKTDITYDNIQQCVNGVQGDELLASYGNRTNELEPKLSSVPYVIFNEKYVEGQSSKATADFRSALCAQISGNKPAECNTKSSSLIIQASILPMIFSVIISRICM